MPKITIDGVETETREGISVLQAALDAGLDVPHYCYHPGLSVVASCRLCLMEMKMRNPRSGEMEFSPKLVPSCQTPVRDGLEVRFQTEKVKESRTKCMEYLLLNHPLDCPVCDQAGECLLQDYSERFGNATSRMVEQKHVAPKKDIGPQTLLYSDRCILCTRCVRFSEEISGTDELAKINRGSRAEIDVFPGKPLDNPLQGNVVDVCPVGALLDKNFLFKKRVWFLESAESICPGCDTGCAIFVDQHEETIQRLRPRFNPGVNDWWMCDIGRFGYKYVHSDKRITTPVMQRGEMPKSLTWEEVPGILKFRFTELAEQPQHGPIALVLSPFLACEEAWLMIRFIREIAPQALLVPGPIPVEEQNQDFPVGATGEGVKFTIGSEKCPNRRGIELLIREMAGPTATWDEFLERSGKGEFSGVWITGGYPSDWADKSVLDAISKTSWLVVSDMLENKLTEKATLLLPSCSFAERDGSFINRAGKIQPFKKAITPPNGCRRDGQYLYETAGMTGLYNAKQIRDLMAKDIPAFADVWIPPASPCHQH